MAEPDGLAPDYEILGVSLVGPPPLRAVHLQWHRGLTVLYGANGAGKSTILRGISNVLKGETEPDGYAYLHLRVTEAADPLDWHSEYFVLDLVESIREWVQHAYFDPAGPMFESAAGSYGWAEHEALFGSDSFGDYLRAAVGGLWAGFPNGEQITEATVRAQTVSLVSQGGGSWRILAGIPGGIDAGALEKALAPIRSGDYRLRGGPSKVPKHLGPLMFAPGDDERFHHAAVLAETDPPAWVPIPVAQIGTLSLDRLASSAWYGPDVIEHTPMPLDKLTQEFLLTGGAGSRDELFSFVPGGESGALVEVSPNLGTILAEIEKVATNAVSAFHPSVAGLRLRLCEPLDWLEGRFVRWTALDRPSGNEVPIETLSEAQHIWASIAVQTALWAGRTRSFHSTVLIDEPERALHTAAASRVAQELADFGAHLPVIVTSHSAAFLNLPAARLVYVERDEGGQASASTMPDDAAGTLREMADRIGLSPAEALQLTRLWLVVEGEHDRAVFETLFGQELLECRTSILTVRGALNVRAVVESQLLMDYTSAPVLVVLDGSGPDRITEPWRAADELAKEGRSRDAIRVLESTTDRRSMSSIETAALDLGRAALETSRWSRLHLHVLSEADVMFYVDAEALAPGLGGWDEINAAHRADRLEREKIKEWLRRKHDVRVSASALRRAASKLDHVHPDLTELLKRIRSLSGTVRDLSTQ